MSKGDLWQVTIVEAFRRLPPDQIDDGVFDAIEDLLTNGTIQTQILTLELLKFGRLRRTLTENVWSTIKALARHDNIRIRRRAIHVLGDLDPGVAVPALEHAVTARMHRVTDQYRVIEYCMKYLAKIGNDDSCKLLAKIVSSYWHAANKCSGIDIDNKILLKLIYDQDRMVRIGALMLIKQKKPTEMAGELEKYLSNCDKYSTGFLKKSELPVYFNNDHLFMFQVKDAHERGVSVEHVMAEKAIKLISEAIDASNSRDAALSRIRNLKQVDDMIELLQWTGKVKGCGLFELEAEVIRRGLIVRSGRQWTVARVWRRYSGSGIHITSNPKIGSRAIMPPSDWETLLGLLDLKEDKTPPARFFVIPTRQWDRDYEKEFCFRAWGMEPLIRGWHESYD